MKQQRKVIHVELKEPYNGKSHYYFGSVSAISEVLPPEVVGLTKETIWNNLSSGEHRGRKATIRSGILHTKKTDRGIKKSKED